VSRNAVPHAFDHEDGESGPFLQDGADCQRQNETRNVADGTDANRPLRKSAHRVDFFGRVFRLAQQQSCMWEKGAADCRQLHPLRMALEKRRTNLLFETTYRAAERRLRDVQHISGTTEAAGRDDDQEGVQLSQVQGHAKR
jgi:hypothetical protein